jgi:uncharacterized membrane protein YdbT with pleckstrin-like domain
MKLIRAGYAVVALIVVAAFVIYNAYATTEPVWLPAVSLALFLWPAWRQVRRGLTRITIAGDKLRFETGFLSKTTRSIQLSKIQDVRVDQAIGQRMLGVGDLSIETAGDTSALTLKNIDAPQRVADRLMDAARAGFAQDA